jgi:predicted lipoprotein with Yx(FWY)xxD motif
MDQAHASQTNRGRSLRRLAAVTLALGGLAVAGLAPAAAGATPSQMTATQVSTAKDAKLGTILVAGDTVYTLKPSKTRCTAACLKAWPPVVLPSGVTSATAGNGVDGTKLGTKTLADGSLQITYDAKPLYWFAKDKAPSEVKGNVTDKWGKWATVVTAKSSSGSKGGTGTTNAGTGGTAF